MGSRFASLIDFFSCHAPFVDAPNYKAWSTASIACDVNFFVICRIIVVNLSYAEFIQELLLRSRKAHCQKHKINRMLFFSSWNRLEELRMTCRHA